MSRFDPLGPSSQSPESSIASSELQFDTIKRTQGTRDQKPVCFADTGNTNLSAIFLAEIHFCIFYLLPCFSILFEIFLRTIYLFLSVVIFYYPTAFC